MKLNRTVDVGVGMKRHFIGFILSLLAFSLGFWLAPIRFTSEGVGSGALTRDGNNFCSFSVHSSTHFERLSSWSCTFDEEADAHDYFESLIRNNITISNSDSHIVVKSEEDSGDYFCSSRIEGRFILNNCSHSLDHITEYERQFFLEL